MGAHTHTHTHIEEMEGGGGGLGGEKGLTEARQEAKSEGKGGCMIL